MSDCQTQWMRSTKEGCWWTPFPCKFEKYQLYWLNVWISVYHDSMDKYNVAVLWRWWTFTVKTEITLKIKVLIVRLSHTLNEKNCRKKLITYFPCKFEKCLLYLWKCVNFCLSWLDGQILCRCAIAMVDIYCKNWNNSQNKSLDCQIVKHSEREVL